MTFFINVLIFIDVHMQLTLTIFTWVVLISESRTFSTEVILWQKYIIIINNTFYLFCVYTFFTISFCSVQALQVHLGTIFEWKWKFSFQKFFDLIHAKYLKSGAVLFVSRLRIHTRTWVTVNNLIECKQDKFLKHVNNGFRIMKCSSLRVKAKINSRPKQPW